MTNSSSRADAGGAMLCPADDEPMPDSDVADSPMIDGVDLTPIEPGEGWTVRATWPATRLLHQAVTTRRHSNQDSATHAGKHMCGMLGVSSIVVFDPVGVARHSCDVAARTGWLTHTGDA